MLLLIAGLVVFLGAHSVRIFAEDWRARLIATRGEGMYKGIYTLASLVGLILIIWGYSSARTAPVVLWVPPRALAHAAALLMGISFVMLAGAYVPRNNIKAKLKHPMVLGVKVWAFAHLLANGNLADVVLFGSFLVWAVLNFRAARARDRALDTTYPPGTAGATMLTVIIGIAAWAVFTFWAHALLIGVAPLG
jgi:uncharacterized membrane protein